MEFKIELVETKNGMFKFSVNYGYDKSILLSELYTHKSACNNAIGSFKILAKEIENYDISKSNGKDNYFYIRRKNGQIIVKSQKFNSIAYMELIINNLINSTFK